MRWLFLLPPFEYYSPSRGGALATITEAVGRELAARGHEVLVAAPGDEAHGIHPTGRYIALGAQRPASFATRRLHAAESRLRGWDWPWQRRYLSTVRMAAARAGAVDVVVTFNDFQTGPSVRALFPEAIQVTWLQNEQRSRRLVGLAPSGPDVVIACSDHVRAWTERQHPALAGTVVTVPSGVDLDAFAPRSGWEEAAGVPRVLFLGRLDLNKGPDVVLSAVARLRLEGLQVTCTVAGGTWFYERSAAEDPYERRLRDLAVAAGAAMTGHIARDRVPAVVREHDIAIFPSRAAEPFGLVVLEAMASGCAVIASERGGMPEAAGGAAILVDPDADADTVAALRRLIEDRSELLAWKRRAIERAARQPWSATADRLLEATRR